MRALLASTLFVFAAIPDAHATGTLACSIEHQALTMSIEGIFSHGVGEQLTDVRGDLSLTHPLITSDLKSRTLERQDVTQFWMTGRDLKLRLYRDSTLGTGESYDIVIEATGKAGDEGMSYSGSFKATLSHLKDGATEPETKSVNGKVSCSSD